MSISQPPFQSTLVDANDRVQTPWAQWFSQLQPILQSVVASGPTSGRPTQNLYIGYPYFDTTIDQMVYWNGVIWVTYAPSTTGTNILKGNGSGGFNNAVAGVDFAPATSGNAILYGNGAGGFSSVSIGSGVTFAGGVLSATGSGGTVTAVTGTAPIASSGGNTPAISISQAGVSTNGYLSSTDWNTFNNKAPATSGTAILYGNGTGGFSNVTIGSGVTFVAGTLSATGSGGTVTAVTGSGNIASSGGTTPNITFTGTLPIANGGTNGIATPSSGAVAYGTGTAYDFTSVGATGQYLQSNGTSAPTWSSISSGLGSPAYYGLMISTTNQANGGSTTANIVALDSSPVLSNGVSVVATGKITFSNAGKYHLITEISFINTVGSNPSTSVWLTQNGSIIPNSAQDVIFQGGAGDVETSSCAWILDIAAGDYVQIYWFCGTTTVSLAYQGASTSPTRPASPSAIVSVFSLSQIGIGYYGLSSITSNAIGTGNKTFTTNLSNLNTAFVVGTRIRVAYVTTPANFMEGVITSFSGTTLIVNVDSIGGSGTYANWTISVAGIQGSNGVTSITGTANQVIASASTGAVTLSLPQDIATTSSPTFVGTNFSGTATSLSIGGNAATASKWATARNLAGNSVDGSANVAFANKFIVQGTTDTGLTGAQFLGALGTGLVKNTTSTGVLSIATSGTDYAPATSGSAILYGNGSGGFSSVTIGTGVSFTTGTLSATGSGGTVTSVGGTGSVNGITLTGTVTSSGSLTLGGTLGSIANSQLTNSSITFGATAQALGSTVSAINAVTLGQTTAAAGKFTTLISTSGATLQGVTAGLGGGSQASATAFGTNALAATNTGNYNSAFGSNSLTANTSGASNSAFGLNTLIANITGNNNSAFGDRALSSNTASNNSAFGYLACTAITSGGFNCGFGTGALQSNSTGSWNSAFGASALINATGNYNTAIGFNALSSVTSGVQLVAVGYGAGSTISTGNYGIYLGLNTTASSSSVNYEYVLGNSLTGKGTNTAFIGGTSGAYNGANLATWAITSDERIKTNIKTITNGLDIILALRPVEFDYKISGLHDESFIAQEYQQILPNHVKEHAANAEQKAITHSDTLLGLTPNLTPYMTNAIQTLFERIQKLELEIEKLNG